MYRYADDQLERLPALAAELVQQGVALIVAQGLVVLPALRQATSTLPIIIVIYNGDPVRDGVIASFARPGGTITGLTLIGPRIASKRLELLKATVPSVAQVAVLWHTATASVAQLVALQAAAPAAGVQVQSLEVLDMSALPSILASALAAQPDALIVTDDSIWLPHLNSIGAFAVRHRLPAMSNSRPSVENGMLLKYGPDVLDLFRRGASYVDMILRGAPPGELPMEEPAKFDFLINVTTARALGITVPPAVLAQATEVLQ